MFTLRLLPKEWTSASLALALALAGLVGPATVSAQSVGGPPAAEEVSFPLLHEDDDKEPGEEDGVDYGEDDDQGRGGGGHNVVQVKNRKDGRMRIRGRVQLNRIRGDRVEPVNYAIAYNQSCTDCKSIAVALQVNLISRTASHVAPQNVGFALNLGSEQERCVRCVVVAKAIQYVYSVDDPSFVPDEASQLIREIDRELRDLHRDSKRITLPEAEARVNAVVTRFQQVRDYFNEARDEQVSPDDGSPPAPAPAAAPSAAPAAPPPAGAEPQPVPAAPGTAPAESPPQPSPTTAVPSDAPVPTPTSTPTPTPTGTPTP